MQQHLSTGGSRMDKNVEQQFFIMAAGKQAPGFPLIHSISTKQLAIRQKSAGLPKYVVERRRRLFPSAAAFTLLWLADSNQRQHLYHPHAGEQSASHSIISGKIRILLFCKTTCSSLALCGASHHVYLSAFTQLVNQWGSLILTWLIIAEKQPVKNKEITQANNI